MNRRKILKGLVQTMAGILVTRSFVLAVPSQDSARLETVRRMANEPPAEAWASHSGAGSTLVYFGDGPAFEVTFPSGAPEITSRRLSLLEMDDLQRYLSEIRPHLPTEIGARVAEGKYFVRGWIYNGRCPGKWIMSVEA